MNRLFEKLLSDILNICRSNTVKDKKLDSICKILMDKVPHYDWVGFYFARVEEKMLILETFAGEPTEHIKIHYGNGICGQSAETEKMFVIDDISKETNYLCCSINVKSEIVIPIFKNNKFIAELDIDSYSIAPFTDDDKIFLEVVCEYVAKIL